MAKKQLVHKKPKCIDMEVAVANLFEVRKQFAIVPNISWSLFSHELDLLIVRKSGYAIEVEIKVSKSDLKKDAQKRHQHRDRLDRIKELYFAVPDHLVADCMEYAPPHAGIIKVEWKESDNIYDKPCFTATIERPPLVRISARALTKSEMLCVARLGAMRIWRLKANLATARESR